MKIRTLRPTATVAPSLWCQPGNTARPVGPVCPNPEGTRAVSAKLAKKVSRMMVKDLVSRVGAKSPADLVFEYTRPKGSPKLTGVAINIVEGDAIVEQFVGEPGSWSEVKEGGAIQFTLAEAFKKYGKKLLDYSIVTAIAFEAGAAVADPGEIIAMRLR